MVLEYIECVFYDLVVGREGTDDIRVNGETEDTSCCGTEDTDKNSNEKAVVKHCRLSAPGRVVICQKRFFVPVLAPQSNMIGAEKKRGPGAEFSLLRHDKEDNKEDSREVGTENCSPVALEEFIGPLDKGQATAESSHPVKHHCLVVGWGTGLERDHG